MSTCSAPRIRCRMASARVVYSSAFAYSLRWRATMPRFCKYRLM